jgi:hypothetical protein
VEHELAFVASSPDNTMCFCGIGPLSLVVPHLSNIDVFPGTRKELQEYILVSPSRLFLSFTIVSLLAYLLVTLSKFT